MGVRFPGAGTTTALTGTLVTNNETAVFTSQPLNISLDFQQVMLYWYMQGTLGASATSIFVKVRRGSGTGGTLLSTSGSIVATAASGYLCAGCYVDTPGAVAGQQYTMTLQQSAATGNGTVADGCLIVLCL